MHNAYTAHGLQHSGCVPIPTWVAFLGCALRRDDQWIGNYRPTRLGNYRPDSETTALDSETTLTQRLGNYRPATRKLLIHGSET